MKKFVRKPEKERQLGRPRRRREHNSKGSYEIGCVGVDWIDVAQDKDSRMAVAKAMINNRVLKNAKNFYQ
jgi:hypothetical protein